MRSEGYPVNGGAWSSPALRDRVLVPAGDDPETLAVTRRPQVRRACANRIADRAKRERSRNDVQQRSVLRSRSTRERSFLHQEVTRPSKAPFDSCRGKTRSAN